MAIRIAVGVAVVVAIVLGSRPLAVPDWAWIAFVAAIALMAVALTVKRVRTESRLVRAVRKAVTGR